MLGDSYIILTVPYLTFPLGLTQDSSADIDVNIDINIDINAHVNRMSALFDLSLFAVSPTNDTHFAVPEDELQPRHPPTWPAAPPSPRRQRRVPSPPINMKPLPPVPRRRLCENLQDPRHERGEPRCILSRIRRMKLDSPAPLQPSTLPRPVRQQTLQERRNPTANTTTLTLPTTPSSPSPSRPPLPMIWLPDEEMWLVADPNDPQTAGYYAPTSGDYEFLPPYTESPASDPSPSDLSPVRTQFLALMEEQRANQQRRGDGSANGCSCNCCSSERRHSSGRSGDRRGEQRFSPMFQEAISGVGLLPSYGETGLQPFEFPQRTRKGRVGGGDRAEVMSGLASPDSKNSWERRERRDSWHSDSGVSPLSPEQDSRWRIQRASSARH